MHPILLSILYVIISCVMLYFARGLFDRFSSFKIDEQIRKKNGTAMFSFVGYLLGIVSVLVASFIGPNTESIKTDILMYVAYAFLGIFLMIISGFAVDKILLHKFDCKKELLEDKNIGTAAVYFAFYLATGLISAACVNGEYGGILSSIVYYLFGILFMVLFVKLYDVTTPYSVHEELEKDNYAVGIALAGNIIAIGLILMKATLGDMPTLRENVIYYLTDLTAIFLLLPAVRFILFNILVRNINLNKEIKENNVAAGILEFVSIICFALIVFFVVDFSFVI